MRNRNKTYEMNENKRKVSNKSKLLRKSNLPIITNIPVLQRPLTVSKPMPEFPPVTIATLLARFGGSPALTQIHADHPFISLNIIQ